MRRTIIAVLATASAMLAMPLYAQDMGGNLAREWVVVPKPGMEQQLEAAMKAHNAWRQENGDTWHWNTYHPVTGEHLNSWLIRSPGHSYADFDAYGDTEFSEKAYEHWLQNVDPHVAAVHGHITEYAPEISNWPDESAPYEWYWVYTYHLEPGSGRDFLAAATAITDVLKAQGWDQEYGWISHLDGEHLPAMGLVIPENDWGGFDTPESGPYEVVVEAKGEEAAKAMWADFNKHVKFLSSNVYHRHADLSY